MKINLQTNFFQNSFRLVTVKHNQTLQIMWVRLTIVKQAISIHEDI